MAGLMTLLGLTLAMIGGGVLTASATKPNPLHKVDICHAEPAADNQPTDKYGLLNVDIASSGYVGQGHDGHAKDIIPPYDYQPVEGSLFHYDGRNWDAQGQSIWNAGCKMPAGITTAVFNAATNAALGSDLSLQAPATVYDTAAVTHSIGTTPTGSVTYIFYATGNCTSPSALGKDHSTKTLAGGIVPPSKSEGPLDAGSYSFKALYSGDANFQASSSACEPFTVTAPPPPPVVPTITTACGGSLTIGGLPEGWHVVVEPGDHFWGNGTFPLAIGAYSWQLRDAQQNDQNGQGQSGSFSIAACPNPEPVIPSVTTACGGSVTIGGLPEGWHLVVEPGDHFWGNGTFPLAIGAYNWQLRDAQQNDQNGQGQSGSFSIAACAVYDPSTHTTTVVFDNATKAALPASLTITPGGSVYDTSSVTHVGGGTPTGTISYRFWTNGTCSGTYSAAGTNLALGSKSSVEGPLGAGKYSFKAYFTSSNQDLFNNSESACEPFTAGGTGEVLAATALTTPTQSLALGLVGFGLLTMMAAFAWRRRLA